MSEPYDSQQRYRESAEVETRRHGFEPGKLQYLWRTPECFTRVYDQCEVGAAICDALTREGCSAWWGDGTSCVEQMVRLQWDRAVKAETECAALRERIRALTEALAPFARYADTEFTNSDIDGCLIGPGSRGGFALTLGDLRRARAALLGPGEQR